MNKAILMGRLTKDPELRTTQNGTAVCTFTVAVDRKGKEKQTDFLPCVAWRQTAEFITKYFTKGRMILLVGSVQNRDYTDKAGNKRIVTEIIVDEVSFCGDKATAEKPSVPVNVEVDDDLDDDELPF